MTNNDPLGHILFETLNVLKFYSRMETLFWKNIKELKFLRTF